MSSGGCRVDVCACHRAEMLVGSLLRLEQILVYCHQQTDFPVVLPCPGPQILLLCKRIAAPPTPHPYTAGFMESGPLPQLHEGPPACHPTTLLINSILTQLLSGSSQEGSVNWGRGAVGCRSVPSFYFPLLRSDLLGGLSVFLTCMSSPIYVHLMLIQRRFLNDVLLFTQVSRTQHSSILLHPPLIHRCTPLLKYPNWRP